MNLLTIVILVLFAIFMLRGYRRGFIKSLASVISLAASVLLVSFVTPYVSEFLETQTPLYSYVQKKCQETFVLETQEEDDTASEETDSGEDANASGKIALLTESETTGQGAAEETDSGTELQDALIDNLELPTLLKTMLKSNNTQTVWQELAADSFNEYVPKFMAHLIMRILSFVVTWILVASFIWLAVMTLDVISNLPVIHGINQLLGIGLGFVQGLVIVWMIFLAITVFSNTQAGAKLLEMIADSPLLRWIYDANLFLDFLQSTAQSV